MSQSHEGSSPLTRGKPEADRARREQVRLIPAHAGKTMVSRASRFHCGAHPRSRGENAIAGAFASRRAGSSPLTRGKLQMRASRANRARLIPAHAGKTTDAEDASPGRGAHPRSRGENLARRSHVRAWAGSSPLTRGKPLSYPRTPRRSGLIPAHAGKTVPRRRCPWEIKAHPRSRGENFKPNKRAAEAIGSSPFTRGKHRRETVNHPPTRLIPAHAGKT